MRRGKRGGGGVRKWDKKREKRGGGGAERRGEGGLGVIFWNVAGLRSKDRNFWRSLEKWEVVVLMET